MILEIALTTLWIFHLFHSDSCCVGFDGTDVWCLPRAHRAIITQCNTVDLTRRSPSFEMRLAKYSRRGFEVCDIVPVPLLARIISLRVKN